MDFERARRFAVGLVTVLSLVGATLPAAAERIASRAEGPAATSREADLARVSEVAARSEVAQALAAHGLDRAQVDDRLAALSDADLQRLAANLDQVQAAGEVPQYIWVLLAIFLAVSILVAVF